MLITSWNQKVNTGSTVFIFSTLSPFSLHVCMKQNKQHKKKGLDELTQQHITYLISQKYLSSLLADRGIYVFQPMRRKRRYLSAVALNGRLYAIGGYDASSRLNTVECFDSSTSQWSAMTPMLQRRGLAGATTLGGQQICDRMLWYHKEIWQPNTINPLHLKSDKHLISPNGITPE